MKLIIAYQFHQASFTRYALTTIDITRQANTNKYLPALSTNSVGIIIRGNDVFVKQHGCATVIITNATQHVIHHINTTHCVTVTLTPLLISSHSHVPTQQVEPFAHGCPVVPFTIVVWWFVPFGFVGVWVRLGAHTRRRRGIGWPWRPIFAWMALVCGEGVIVYRLL
jgi:hypothetical protein